MKGEFLYMEKVILYSTGCPKCKVLKSKLDEKSIECEIISDMDTIISLGFKTVPLLSVDGNIMQFADAVKWVNNK